MYVKQDLAGIEIVLEIVLTENVCKLCEAVFSWYRNSSN